jgi:predicted restriction endonuclease
VAGCSGLRSDHIEHWADGGETNLKNTLLLCSKHHRLLHEGGYTIKKNYLGERYFETAQGKIVT